MPVMLDESVKQQVSQRFTDMKEPVTIRVFSTKDHCLLCNEMLDLVEQVGKLSEKITVKHCDCAENDPEINRHLLWLNWTEIWSVLKDVYIDEFPFLQIRKDLICLLEKKGFKHFHGFSFKKWNLVYQRFYKELWFDFKNKNIVYEYKKFYKEG